MNPMDKSPGAEEIPDFGHRSCAAFICEFVLYEPFTALLRVIDDKHPKGKEYMQCLVKAGKE